MSIAKFSFRSLYLILAMFILSCTTSTFDNRSMTDLSQAERISVGKTTKAGVLRLLGVPHGERNSSDGTSIFTYSNTLEKTDVILWTYKRRTQGTEITIFFDDRNVVSKIDYSPTNER